MSFHVGGAGAGAKTAKFVFDEKFADERFAEAGRGGVSVHVNATGSVWDSLGDVRRAGALREGHVVPQDIRECGVPVLSFKRCCAEQHFVNENS